MYVVCQTGKCQQTYALEKFSKEAKDVSCEKCGGVLIDGEGRANLSQNATVIPVISVEELSKQRNRELQRKREELKLLEEDIRVLEQED